MLLIYIFLLIGIHLIHVPVKGVSFSFTETRVVRESGQTVLRCAADESGIRSVLVMQLKIILGKDVVNLGTLTSTGLTQSIPAGLTDRMTIAGSLDSTNPTNSRVSLTIDKEKVQCSDSTQYQCSVTCLTNSTNPETLILHQNASLEVYVYPSMTSLIGKVNGRVEDGSRATIKAPAKVGDVLELACTANIGSVSSNNIQWRRTSELTATDYWNEYHPPMGSSVVTDPVKDGCGFVKTDTITYNLTVSDANRINNLAFECYVKADGAPYDGRKTANNPNYYVEVVSGNIGSLPTPSSVHRQTDELDAESPDSIYDELNNISFSGSTYSPLEQVAQAPALVEYDNKICGKDTYVNSPAYQYEQIISVSSSGSTYSTLQPASKPSQTEDNKVSENASYINPI